MEAGCGWWWWWANGKRYCWTLSFFSREKEKRHIYKFYTDCKNDILETKAARYYFVTFFNESGPDNATAGMAPDVVIEGARNRAFLAKRNEKPQLRVRYKRHRSPPRFLYVAILVKTPFVKEHLLSELAHYSSGHDAFPDPVWRISVMCSSALSSFTRKI